MSCACTSVDVAPPRRYLRSFSLQVVAADLPDRARIYPGAGVIQVSGPWWATLDDAERAAVLAHERAHEENQRETCESCTDMRAGAIMRHEGWSRDIVVDSFRKTVRSREAGKSAGRGWDATDRAIEAGVAVSGIAGNAPSESPSLEEQNGAVDPGAAPVVVDAEAGAFSDSKAASGLTLLVFVVIVVCCARYCTK